MSVEELRLIRYPDRASWLEGRRMSIGSSDAAALLGESNYSTPTTLNYSKRGLIPLSPPDPDRELALDWHRRREAEIADWWWERLQPQVEGLAFKAAGPCFLWNPGDHTVAVREVDGIPLSATFDRLLLRDEVLIRDAARYWSYLLELERGSDGKWELPPEDDPVLVAEERILGAIVGVVELKNAGHWMARHWEEEPPLIYQLQLQHQLMVADVRPGYLIASIGGQPPVWAQCMRDGGTCGLLRSAYSRFWDSVTGNYDLPTDYRDVTSKAITARFGEGEDKTTVLGEDSLRWWKNRVRAAESKAGAESLYQEATNNLKQALGEAWYGVLPGGAILSLRPDKNGNRSRLRLVNEEGEGIEAGDKSFGGL